MLTEPHPMLRNLDLVVSLDVLISGRLGWMTYSRPIGESSLVIYSKIMKDNALIEYITNNR